MISYHNQHIDECASKNEATETEKDKYCVTICLHKEKTHNEKSLLMKKQLSCDWIDRWLNKIVLANVLNIDYLSCKKFIIELSITIRLVHLLLLQRVC
jgi:hypothetical protein